MGAGGKACNIIFTQKGDKVKEIKKIKGYVPLLKDGPEFAFN